MRTRVSSLIDKQHGLVDAILGDKRVEVFLVDLSALLGLAQALKPLYSLRVPHQHARVERAMRRLENAFTCATRRHTTPEMDTALQQVRDEILRELEQLTDASSRMDSSPDA